MHIRRRDSRFSVRSSSTSLTHPLTRRSLGLADQLRVMVSMRHIIDAAHTTVVYAEPCFHRPLPVRWPHRSTEELRVLILVRFELS